LEHYTQHQQGYEGLKKALAMTPDAVIDEVKKSGLRGRGGAGFPTGQKWDTVRRADAAPKYVICNGDEGAGAYIDRYLLVKLTACSWYADRRTDRRRREAFYVRAEYPAAIAAVRAAVSAVTAAGFAVTSP
jgi:formate dehydrogenase iron-sulfur subunit